jgi:putative DNA-invertase from lambdoid prophage Rac
MLTAAACRSAQPSLTASLTVRRRRSSSRTVSRWNLTPLLGGDIAGNGISKLLLTIAAAFAEAERDLIRERIGQVKADQKSRGRFLGGTVPSGYRLGDDDDELVPVEAQQEAILEMAALQARGLSLRAIAAAIQISHVGVQAS